jgi:hypothetical protein
MSRVRRRAGGLLALLVVLAPAPARAAPAVPIPAVVHVHTTFSSGADRLDAVIERARAAGLGAVLLTENYALAFEYAVEPLAGLLRVRERFPSLAAGRLGEYLAAVGQARQRHPDMVLVPGLEIIPYYYWTGSLLDRALTMHDGQKNLLIFGLERAEDLAGLPIVGNGRPLGAVDWLVRLAPLVLAGAGVWVYRLRRVRLVRWRQYRIRREVRYRWAGAGLMALGLLLATNGVLAGASYWDPRSGPQGYAPHQAAIDFVAGRGGVSAWSLPEARDFSVHRRAGITVTVRTEPYPHALAATHGYAAFGAIYADRTSIEAPEGLWDRLLLDYLAGRRPGWPVALGESAFHFEGQAGKWLDEVQTVFLAAERTPAGVLRAMRDGRAFAHRRKREYGLVLERFTVNGASLGETAQTDPGVPPRIDLALGASDGRAHPVEVTLIRSGTVLTVRKGSTPVTLDLEDRQAPRAGAGYYRLDVRGEPGIRLLTNPIFFRVRA